MRRTLTLVLILLGISAAPADEARTILDGAGVKGGFIVHLGCGDGDLTAALRAGEGFQVHGLDRNARKVESASGLAHSNTLRAVRGLD